ncbi:MAG: N-acetylmuramoyl-L-alanine amidase [Alphaproteobacteria bacterium]|nr:N-acetylmuramoyl-L-alanine amidase [Alphaproteobacteria bacterium]
MKKGTNRVLHTISAMIFGCIALFISSIEVQAETQNSYIDFRFGQVSESNSQNNFANSATRIVVETSHIPEARLSLLDSPYRLVIDTTNSSWNMPNFPKSGKLSYGPITSWRYGNPTANTGRLVFELSEPAAPVAAFMLPPKQSDSARKPGYRIVIDISNRGKTAFALARSALKKTPYLATSKLDSALNEQADNTNFLKVEKKPEQNNNLQTGGKVVELKSPEMRPKRWVVTIDAGHGGKDPGAIGFSGTKEKEITFKASQRLAYHLNKSGRVIARLTREDDSFIKLRDRIAIARQHQADLFVSLHADAAPNAKANGISVFSLSDTASDKEAALIAERENKADLLGGPDLSIEDPLAANALLSMFQRESMNESTYIAKSILNHVRSLPGGDKRGHRFAGFAVLKSPDIPSVLVEMGFLTNKKDEANLKKDSYIDDLTKKIADAIIAYLNASLR